MPVARRTVPPAVLLLLVALLASCTVGPSDRPPVAVRDAGVAGVPPIPPLPPTTPTVPAPAGRYDPASLPWSDCTADLAPVLGAAVPPLVECAEIRVDADLAFPGGGSLRLDLSRTGSGPAPLVVLGEAGGEPGTVRAARLATVLPAEVLEAYTLIGLARRGTGPTDPVDCVAPDDREQILGADPDPSLEQLDDLLDVTRTSIQTCVQELGPLLTTIGSSATADDLELLRVALAAPVVNLLVLGDGSRAAATFLERYPGSVGRAVLDGAPDPDADLIALAEATAGAAEQGFDAFAADCVARGCPLAPDPRAVLVELAASLRAAPLPAGEQLVTAGIAHRAVLEALGDPPRWPELVDALAAARAGDGTGLAALVRPLVAEIAGLPARFDPELATMCNDNGTRLPPERTEQLVAEWRGRHPLFGAMQAQRLLLCSAWPVPAPSRVVPSGIAPPPALVIATAGDPHTPSAGTRRAAGKLPSAVLLTWQGTAHGAVGRSPCATDAVRAYLVDAVLPTPETLCPP